MDIDCFFAGVAFTLVGFIVFPLVFAYSLHWFEMRRKAK